MGHAWIGAQAPQLEQCRYDGSDLLFRGPRKPLDADFIACLGGSETFGRFIAAPFPDLLEEATGVICVNFGWPNAGVDVLSGDGALLDCAARARLTVIEVPGAVNMSNMYYRVHPRRNDRFLAPSEALRALYPEVDFTEFSFTRHLLGRLRDLSGARFAYIRRELCTLWVAGMRTIIGQIDGPVVLMWFGIRTPDRDDDTPDIAADPALVSRAMLEALRDKVAAIVEVPFGRADRGADTGGGRRGEDLRAARELLSPGAHRVAATTLAPVARAILQG